MLLPALLALGFMACQPNEESLRGRAGIILEHHVQWMLLDSILPEHQAPHFYSTVIFGDSVIEGERWWKLYERDGRQMVVKQLLRQEGEQIYRYDAQTGEKLLVYDFDVKEGDRVTVYGLDGPETLTVEKVGDTVFPGEDMLLHRAEPSVYRYVSLSAGDFHDTWVEDMGSLRTGFYFRGTSTKFEGVFFAKQVGEWLYSHPVYPRWIN